MKQIISRHEIQVKSSLKTAPVFATKGAGDQDGTLPEQAAVQAVKQIISRREMILEACLIRPRWFASFFSDSRVFRVFLGLFPGGFYHERHEIQERGGRTNCLAVHPACGVAGGVALFSCGPGWELMPGPVRVPE